MHAHAHAQDSLQYRFERSRGYAHHSQLSRGWWNAGGTPIDIFLTPNNFSWTPHLIHGERGWFHRARGFKRYCLDGATTGSASRLAELLRKLGLRPFPLPCSGKSGGGRTPPPALQPLCTLSNSMKHSANLSIMTASCVAAEKRSGTSRPVSPPPVRPPLKNILLPVEQPIHIEIIYTTKNPRLRNSGTSVGRGKATATPAEEEPAWLEPRNARLSLGESGVCRGIWCLCCFSVVIQSGGNVQDKLSFRYVHTWDRQERRQKKWQTTELIVHMSLHETSTVLLCFPQTNMAIYL